MSDFIDRNDIIEYYNYYRISRELDKAIEELAERVGNYRDGYTKPLYPRSKTEKKVAEYVDIFRQASTALGHWNYLTSKGNNFKLSNIVDFTNYKFIGYILEMKAICEISKKEYRLILKRLENLKVMLVNELQDLCERVVKPNMPKALPKPQAVKYEPIPDEIMEMLWRIYDPRKY